MLGARDRTDTTEAPFPYSPYPVWIPAGQGCPRLRLCPPTRPPALSEGRLGSLSTAPLRAPGDILQESLTNMLHRDLGRGARETSLCRNAAFTYKALGQRLENVKISPNQVTASLLPRYTMLYTMLASIPG